MNQRYRQRRDPSGSRSADSASPPRVTAPLGRAGLSRGKNEWCDHELMLNEHVKEDSTVKPSVADDI